jgi:hypothetical protein
MFEEEIMEKNEHENGKREKEEKKTPPSTVIPWRTFTNEHRRRLSWCSQDGPCNNCDELIRAEKYKEVIPPSKGCLSRPQSAIHRRPYRNKGKNKKRKM